MSPKISTKVPYNPTQTIVLDMSRQLNTFHHSELCASNRPHTGFGTNDTHLELFYEFILLCNLLFEGLHLRVVVARTLQLLFLARYHLQTKGIHACLLR